MTSATLGAHTRQPVNRWAPAKQGFAAWRRKAALKVRGASVHLVGAQAVVRRLVMTAVALSFIDAGAYVLNLIVGLVATGISVALLNECMN